MTALRSTHQKGHRGLVTGDEMRRSSSIVSRESTLRCAAGERARPPACCEDSKDGGRWGSAIAEIVDSLLKIGNLPLLAVGERIGSNSHANPLFGNVEQLCRVIDMEWDGTPADL